MFVWEDDLHSIEMEDGTQCTKCRPRRLTTSGHCDRQVKQTDEMVVICTSLIKKSDPTVQRRPPISPDGCAIAYTCAAGGTREVFLLPVDGGYVCLFDCTSLRVCEILLCRPPVQLSHFGSSDWDDSTSVVSGAGCCNKQFSRSCVFARFSLLP